MEAEQQIERAVLKPRVSALLFAAVEEVKSATGESPSLDEIIWLHSLVEKQVLPSIEDPPAYMPQPIELVSGLTLYPLTLEAQMWLSEYAVRWFTVDDLPAAVYAMAHSDGRSSFKNMTQRVSAVARVMGWWWMQRASRELATWAVLQMAGRQQVVMVNAKGLTPQEQDEASPFEWGSVIARLCATYHLPPTTFLQMPMSVVTDMLRRAPRLSGAGAGIADETEDPVRQQAFAHTRIVIKHIIAGQRYARAMKQIEDEVNRIEAFVNNKEHADG